MKGKRLKSVIRVGFQERRLQYMEKDLITQWQQQRPSERILEIDIPLSYGVSEVVNCKQNITLCEFLWDPTKETGVFIRVNCISTEFTPKKHGGEKGVPFRIQIETYTQDESSSIRLHVASCQVKVFKPKGADRKHKTDREKMSKRPQAEQDKYQPSYDCTVFKECPVELLSIPSVTTESVPSPTTTTKTSTSQHSPQSSSSDITPLSQQIENNPSTPASSTSELQEVPEASLQGPSGSLSIDATSVEALQWLQHNRFGNYVKVFSNFSGADILRLSRDDLIQICGLADGIRLYNALHSRRIRPRLTMFVCQPPETVFRAIYLEKGTLPEFRQKMRDAFNLPQCINLYTCGPSGIHVLLTEEVIENMLQEAMYTLEPLKDAETNTYGFILMNYHQLG